MAPTRKVSTALARSLMIPGSGMPLGVIIVGVSPRLPLSASYRNHLEQVTAAASVALGNALAYDQERKRAEALAEIDRAKTQFLAWRWWMSFRVFTKAAPQWKASWALDLDSPSLFRAAQGICRLTV